MDRSNFAGYFASYLLKRTTEAGCGKLSLDSNSCFSGRSCEPDLHVLYYTMANYLTLDGRTWTLVPCVCHIMCIRYGGAARVRARAETPRLFFSFSSSRSLCQQMASTTCVASLVYAAAIYDLWLTFYDTMYVQIASPSC